MVVGRLPSFYEGLFSEAMLVLGTVKAVWFVALWWAFAIEFLVWWFPVLFLDCRMFKGVPQFVWIYHWKKICDLSSFQLSTQDFPVAQKKKWRNLLLENFTVKCSLSFQVMSSSHSQCAQQEEDHLANVMKGLGDGFLKLLEVSAGCLVTKICSHVTKLDGKIKKKRWTHM